MMKKPFKLVAGLLLLSSVPPAAVLAEAPDLENEKKLEMLSTSAAELPPLDLEEGYTDFTDAMGTRYAHAVWFMVTNGFAQGKTPTYFGVHEPITRVDAAVILENYAPLFDVSSKESPFTDVPERAQKAVNTLYWYGIVNGKSHTRFDSYSNITRGEAAIMLYIAHETDLQDVELDEAAAFSDVSARYRHPVKVLTAAGIIKGKSDGRFGTNELLTRGQLALILERISEFNAQLGEKDSADYPIEDQGISISTDKASYDLSVDRYFMIILENKADYAFSHHPKFTMQKKVDGEWHEVPYLGELVYNTGFGWVGPNEKYEEPQGLDRMSFRAPLKSGDYRIVQTLFSSEAEIIVKIAAQFEIVE